VVTPAQAYLIDARTVIDRLEPFEWAARRAMRQRMPRATAARLGLAALALFAATFVPACVDTGLVLLGALPLQVAFVAAAIAATALGGLVALVGFRGGIVGRVRRFNGALARACGAAIGSARAFERYLACLGTLMKAHAIRSGADSHEAIERGRHDNLRDHEVHLRRLGEFQQALAISFGVPLGAASLAEDEILFDFTRAPVDSDIYRFPMAQFTPSVPLGASGTEVRGPYRFVAGLDLRRVELYEHKDVDDADTVTGLPGAPRVGGAVAGGAGT
jgi:hypothetical protein